MTHALTLGVTPPGVDDIVAVARHGRQVRLDAAVAARVGAARRLVDDIVAAGRPVYGVNTGFGSLAVIRIPDAELMRLQRNLVASHAAGVGPPLPGEVVRAMMLLLAASLARGHSGVRPHVVDLLVGMLDARITPVVPSKGSVGASGDLAPLAHLALAMCGEGRVVAADGERDAASALAAAGLVPLEPVAKEGLALVNGTHLMGAVGALAVHDARMLQDAAEAAAAMSLDALLGSLTPMDARIHALRGRRQQARVAERVRGMLRGSGMLESHAECERVQDAYTLRCIPQVLGATAEALDYVSGALEPELGAVTDNPLCFPDDDEVLSGGNFHGQPLSLPLDTLAITVAEVAAFSERRTYRMLDGRGDQWSLPPFLTSSPGTRSGLMVLQYTAAALVAENQVLAHPAGTGSLPTSAGQEDFNSMGATAGLKARTAIDNALAVVAIELICAAQAIDLRRPLTSGPGVEDLHARLRRITPMVDEDRPMADDIAAVAAAIRDGALTGVS